MCRQVRGAGGQPFDFDLLGFSRQRFPIPVLVASLALALTGAAALTVGVDPVPILGAAAPTSVRFGGVGVSDGLTWTELDFCWAGSRGEVSDSEPVWLCVDGEGRLVEARWRSHWILRRFGREELEVAVGAGGEERVTVYFVGPWHTPSARGGLAGAFEAWWPVAVVGVPGLLIGTLLAVRLGQGRRRGRRVR